MQGPSRETRHTERAAEDAVRPARTVAAATLLSRILGLVRDKVTVFFFASDVRDAIYLAWTIPNLFRRLFGEGALSAALMPVLAEAEERGGPRERLRVTSSVVSALFVVLVPLALLLIALLVWVPESLWVSIFDSPGVAHHTSQILRWMLPYLVFVCVGAQLQALANAAGRFFVPAFAPALLNVVWIGSAALAAAFAHDSPDPRWIAHGVLAAGLLQIAIQWWDLRRSGNTILPARIWNADVRKVATRAAPMFLGLAASQFNLVIDRWMAEKLVEGEGGVTVLFLANRMMQLPLGLVGVALGTAAFPVIARAAARRDTASMGSALGSALRTAFFLGLPATFGLMALAEPITYLLFAGGEFTAADAARTGTCLVAYAPSIIALSTVLLMARVQYSRERHRLVVRASLLSVAVNLAASLSLVFPFGAPGLAAATSIASVINAAMLATGLELGKELPPRREIAAPFARVAMASLVMAAAVLGARALISQAGMDRWISVGAMQLPLRDGCTVLAGIACGVAVFAVAARVLARAEWTAFVAVFRRRR